MERIGSPTNSFCSSIAVSEIKPSYDNKFTYEAPTIDFTESVHFGGKKDGNDISNNNPLSEVGSNENTMSIYFS